MLSAQCAWTDIVFFPISEVSKSTVSLPDLIEWVDFAYRCSCIGFGFVMVFFLAIAPPPHSGPALHNNLSKLNQLTEVPRHLVSISQRNRCNTNVSLYPTVFASGLEIEFYPILTLK